MSPARRRGRRRGRLALLAAIGALLALPGAAQAVTLGSVGTFDQPVFVTQPPVDDMLVVEKPGVIRVVDSGDVTLPTPFLDITDRVGDGGGEQGLLSVAFHPSYATNRLFYVFYTQDDGDIEIDEFQRDAVLANVADEATRRTVLVIPHHTFGNHNGGQLEFDEAGLLYVSTGDGGGGGDSLDNARKTTTLLGKILRIDPRQNGASPYRNPPSNPFVNRAGRDEVFSYGLRNPYRFALYASPYGPRITIGDVGQGKYEEVDFEKLSDASGANFGWPAREGPVAFAPSRTGAAPPQAPILSYKHTLGRCSIIGGYVVRNSNLPTLENRYIYTDFCQGLLRSMVPQVSGARDDRYVKNGLDAVHVDSPSSFGRDRSGRYYVTSLGGPLYRLIP